jgi:co-chaperonin GroES (HSP10)
MSEEKVNYETTGIHLKKHVILAKWIDAELKKKSSIILRADEKDNQNHQLDDFKDHPYKAEVFMVGPGTEDYFGRSIKRGDIVYFDRVPGPTEYANIDGQVYIRMIIGNVFMVNSSEDAIHRTYKTEIVN